MMKRLSDRSLNLLNFTSLMGVCGCFLPLGYFGEWAMVLAWLASMYLWIESDFEQGRRDIHPRDNA